MLWEKKRMNLKKFAIVILLLSPFTLLANESLIDDKNITHKSVSISPISPLNDVSESNVIKNGNIIQETVSESKILMAADNWCDVRGQYDFFKKGDGWVGFVLKKGTLSGNIERYVATLYPESNGLIFKVGRHLVPGDTCLTGPSADMIMQRIIEPYFAGDIPIIFSSFNNDFYALFYKDDPEFTRYRVGVRR
jgi:hypothetical protein